MPTKQPRINVVLKEPIYHAVETLAEARGLSLSSQVEQLIQDALETIEDIELGRIADERMKTWDRAKALSHEEVWKTVKKKTRHE